MQAPRTAGPTLVGLTYASVLFMVALSLALPANYGSVSNWSEISPVQIIRSAVWAAALSFIPGRLMLRVLRLDSGLGLAAVLPLSVNLSFVLAGFISIISNHALGNIYLFPYLELGLMSALLALSCRTHCQFSLPSIKGVGLHHAALIAGAVISSAISGLVFARHLYLVPGDEWVALTPAIEILNGVDPWVYFERLEYPVFFGYILAGYSASMGIPVVNSNAILFPLSALNILTFYSLVKIMFKKTDSFSVLASIIYAFGGGLGWLIKTLVYPAWPFWAISNFTQDIYFMPFAWGSMDFNYKSLAVTMAFSSFAFFSIALGKDRPRERVGASILASSLFLSAFLIHVLPGFLAPIFVFIALLSVPLKRALSHLTWLALSAIALFVGLDSLTGWINFSLIQVKLPFLSVISPLALLLISAIAFGGAAMLFVLKWLSERSRIRLPAGETGHYLKLLVVACVSSAYIAGLPYSIKTHEVEWSYVEYVFPWNLFITRYGIVGLFGLLGVAVTSWRERWLRIAVLWSLMAIALGSIWWGTRLNAYLHPSLAVLAAAGVTWLWGRAPSIKALGRSLGMPLRACLVIAIALSFTSTMYMDYHYATEDPEIPQDLINMLAWINMETPQNSYLLVPDYKEPLVVHSSLTTIYRWQLFRGLNTISDRDLVVMTGLNGTAASIASLYALLDPSRPAYVVLMASYATPDPVKDLIEPAPIYSVGEFSIHALRPNPDWLSM